MTTGHLQHAIADYRARLLTHEEHAERALEAAYRHTLASIQPKLDQLYEEMVNALGDDGRVPATWLYEANRLEHLKQFLTGQIDHFGLTSKMVVGQVQRAGVQLGVQGARAQLQATVPTGVTWAFGVPSQDAIAALVGATQAGSPLAALFAGFGREAAQNVSDALVTGLTLGNNPRVVARDVQRALGISRNRALTISRTEMLRSYRSANLETYRANSDVVSKWRWTASPSSRTCAMCLAMDGQEFDVSEDFESHANCRCVPVPVTRSWSDILGAAGIDASGIEETSLDMPPASDWFDQQSASVQRQILGPAKYSAYQAGALSLKDLVGTAQSSTWGGSRYEKSLKEAIGAKKASKYYGKAS